MLLKEHRKVEELEKARAHEQKEIAELKQQLKALASGVGEGKRPS